MNRMSSHMDAQGNAWMVDVSGKATTARTAVAEGCIRVSPEVMRTLRQGRVAKGDVLSVAQIAGIMGAKHAADFIPLCHPLPLQHCSVIFELEEDTIRAECTVKTDNKTGVEMEALAGVSIALLTVYDMCKSMDKSMEVTGIRLLRKTGGKSGDYLRKEGAGNTVQLTDARCTCAGPAPGLADSQGRSIDYLRLSITDRCNFRCAYCMPQEGVSFVPHEKILSYEETLRLAAIFTDLGIIHYKVTGGEPLCRKGAVEFIRDLAASSGVAEVTLTTNGSLAGNYLEDLARAGIGSINFSCDAFTPEVFGSITRSSVSPAAIRENMEAAAALGLRVKVNTVPLRGHNEAELLPMARFALERGYHIRFIELMPIGSGRILHGIPLSEVRDMLEREFGPLRAVARKTGNGPAVMYSVRGYPGLVGFIAALSGRFCSTCNRVRLTSTGFFKTCLCHEEGVDLKRAMTNGATDGELGHLILDAVNSKPGGHTFSFLDSGKDHFFMNTVGG